MKKRMFVMLFAVATILVLLGFVKYRQIRAAIQQGESYVPPPEAVTTIVAAPETWQETLEAIGTVTAVQGVTVSAELPGQVASIHFNSGARVEAGDVLVRLDTSQEEAQLKAAEAQQRLSDLNLDRTKTLLAKGFTSQAEFDRAKAEAEQADARVHEIRAVIQRKTIRAPFDGILGIRQINLGQYVNAGQAIVPLQSMNPVYVDFAVPQQEMEHIRSGTELEVTLEGARHQPIKGKVTAINSVIDRETRNFQVQATLPNEDGRLVPGMFVEVGVFLSVGQPMITLPATAISYASYGNFVFVVEKINDDNGMSYLGVRQQFVKLGDARGDQVAVLEGVKVGEEVVTSGVFKLRPGAAVTVTNEIQPSNNPTPDPEDS